MVTFLAQAGFLWCSAFSGRLGTGEWARADRRICQYSLDIVSPWFPAGSGRFGGRESGRWPPGGSPICSLHGVRNQNEFAQNPNDKVTQNMTTITLWVHRLALEMRHAEPSRQSGQASNTLRRTTPQRCRRPTTRKQLGLREYRCNPYFSNARLRLPTSVL